MPDEDKTDTENTGEEKALTEADVIRMVNAAVTAKMRGISQKIGTTIADAIGEHLGPVKEKLESLERAPKTDKPKGEDNLPDEVRERFAQLEAENAKARKANEEMRKQYEAERNKSRKAAETEALKDALTVAKVRPELQGAALATLREKVGRNEDDGIVWLTGDVLEPHATVAAGVKKWAQGDEGKHFIAPTGAKGSGANEPRALSMGKDGKLDHESAGAAIRTLTE